MTSQTVCNTEGMDKIGALAFLCVTEVLCVAIKQIRFDKVTIKYENMYKAPKTTATTYLCSLIALKHDWQQYVELYTFKNILSDSYKTYTKT